jgi:membrane protease YdiL (CAAX protease family)
VSDLLLFALFAVVCGVVAAVYFQRTERLPLAILAAGATIFNLGILAGLGLAGTLPH